MEIGTIIVTVVTSSVIASVVSGLFALAKSSLDYKNEYYKTLLRKRIQSSEYIEELLYCFSTATFDPGDPRMYHIIFSTEDNPLQQRFGTLVAKLSKSNIWISESTRDKIQNLNRFIIENNINFRRIDDGKRFYVDLGNLRNEVLVAIRNEVRELHKFRRLFGEKVSKSVGTIKIPRA